MLLDENYNVLDILELYAGASPAVVRDAVSLEPCRVSFLFGDSTPLVIQIDRNGFRMRGAPDSLGTRPLRRVFGKKYINITTAHER